MHSATANGVVHCLIHRSFPRFSRHAYRAHWFTVESAPLVARTRDALAAAADLLGHEYGGSDAPGPDGIYDDDGYESVDGTGHGSGDNYSAGYSADYDRDLYAAYDNKEEYR